MPDTSKPAKRAATTAKPAQAKSAKPKPAKRTAAKQASGFTAEERAAMKERARELKAAAGLEEAAAAVVAKIAEMAPSDRALVERLHAVITAAAPDLAPRLWYGMPAYAKDGKVVCFVQDSAKFKTRYTTLGFSDEAALDKGSLWPTSYAVTSMTAADEKAIAALVKRAVR